METLDAANKRVGVLIQRQMRSPGEEGEYPVTLELCNIIRRHGADVVLEQLKDPLKHGDVLQQIKTLGVLNQLVLCGGPDVAQALSSEKWSERFRKVAKTTDSPYYRERIIRQLLQWYQKYRTPGLEQCLSRLSQSKSLSDSFFKVSREVENSARGQPTAARSTAAGAANTRTPPSSPVYADPAVASTSFFNSTSGQPRSRTATTTTTTNAAQQQRTSGFGSSAQGQTAVSEGVLSNLETFIMDAQGDLASLEYGLSHPHMLDRTAAMDCKRHKEKVGKLLQLDTNIPQSYNEALFRLLENLSNALELYEMNTGEDIGEGGLRRMKTFGPQSIAATLTSPHLATGRATKRSSFGGTVGSTASGATATSTVDSSPAKADQDSSDDEREMSRIDSSIAERQAVEAQQAAMRMIEQERAELAQARSELNALRTQNEDLQAKYKDAKTKNKKALAMLTESSTTIEELENRVMELSAGGGAAAAKVSPSRVVVEKVVRERPVVSASTLESLRTDMLALRRELRHIKTEVLGDWKREFQFTCSQVQGSVANIVVAAQKERQNDAKALQWAQELYKKEMKLRKQYYNQIQELKGNIRVYCRVRPMSEKELRDGHTCIVQCTANDELRFMDANERVRMLEFDCVFSPESTQAQVFEDTAPLIDSVVDGYNVCIFAYGQTGSGKTHTMGGPAEDKGINKRALDRLFHIIEERKESEVSTVHVSVLEIYCDQIRDLLVSKGEAARNSYDVKTGGPYGNYVTNLYDVEVRSPAEIDGVMDRAAANRSEGKTDMNAHSSRSHMILYVLVRTRNLHTGVQSYGKLSLVDLAGSERLDKSGSEGQAAKEATAINKSLSALGDVIAGLSNPGQKHIPFRNSVLTFLLQDSMAGQAKVLMFCCISPASYNQSESSSSLGFATRARGVSLGQAKRNVIAN